ncbi:hypothetical protein AWENTII_008557 [Aspergillus wentii]
MLPLSLLKNNFAVEESVPLTSREAASGLFGSISLTCWIFLLAPQLIENYRNGNADAISFAFICIWFVGDVTNFIGGVWAGLVPVIILIAVYYCLADGILIGQCLYYKVKNKRHALHRRRSSTETPDPTTPLLGRRFSDSFEGRDASGRRTSQAEDALAKIIEERESGRSAWIKNTGSVLGICLIGMAGWTMAWQSGAWKPTPEDHNGGVDMAAGAQVLGYISAIAYLGARLPQIYKNYSEKSCEGIITHSTNSPSWRMNTKQY